MHLKVAAAAAALAALAGCTSSSDDAKTKAAPTTDPAQHAKAVRAGHLRLQVLTAKCGIFALTGTHAFLDANGEFCRARIRVTSNDSSSHDFSPYAQQLVLADGTAVDPSNGGMAV